MKWPDSSAKAIHQPGNPIAQDSGRPHALHTRHINIDFLHAWRGLVPVRSHTLLHVGEHHLPLSCMHANVHIDPISYTKFRAHLPLDNTARLPRSIFKYFQVSRTPPHRLLPPFLRPLPNLVYLWCHGQGDLVIYVRMHIAINEAAALTSAAVT